MGISVQTTLAPGGSQKVSSSQNAQAACVRSARTSLNPQAPALSHFLSLQSAGAFFLEPHISSTGLLRQHRAKEQANPTRGRGSAAQLEQPPPVPRPPASARPGFRRMDRTNYQTIRINY